MENYYFNKSLYILPFLPTHASLNQSEPEKNSLTKILTYLDSLRPIQFNIDIFGPIETFFKKWGFFLYQARTNLINLALFGPIRTNLEQ